MNLGRLAVLSVLVSLSLLVGLGCAVKFEEADSERLDVTRQATTVDTCTADDIERCVTLTPLTWSGGLPDGAPIAIKLVSLDREGNAPFSAWLEFVNYTNSLVAEGSRLDCVPSGQLPMYGSQGGIHSDIECAHLCLSTPGCAFFAYYPNMLWCNMTATCNSRGPSSHAGRLWQLHPQTIGRGLASLRFRPQLSVSSVLLMKEAWAHGPYELHSVDGKDRLDMVRANDVQRQLGGLFQSPDIS